KLLIDLGVSPVSALSELMRLGHGSAAKMLLRLGADGTALMRSLAAGCADRPQQVDALRALIEVGVDPAPVLCEMARGCKDMTAAKMLVLAGAEIYDAVEYIASADRDELEETLLEVGRDILRTREQMFRTGDDGAGLAATLIAAKDYV